MGPIENWFAQLPNEKRRPKPEEKEALKDFLLGHSTAGNAAARITSPTAELDHVQPGLWDLWSFVNDAAKQLPIVHGKLIDLLVAIKGLPDLKRGGETVKVPDSDRVVWKDLPLWASDIRERWYFSDPEPKNPRQAQIRQEEINTNAFMARITSHRVEDLKLYAIWALRRALEDEPWNWSPPHATDHFDDHFMAGALYRRTIYTLDGFTPPAAQWVIHAGHLIFNCEEEYESGSSDPASGGDLWNGKHGFCRERWDFWKERFAWIQTRDELEDDTKAVAKVAVDAMETVEKEPQTEIWKERLKQ